GFRLGLVALPYLGLAVPGLLRLTLQDSSVEVPSLTFLSSLTSLTALHLKDCDFSTPTYPAPSGPPWSQLLAQLPPLPSLLLLHLAHPPGHPRSAHPLTGPHLHSLLTAAPHLTSLDLGPHQDLAHCCLGVLAAHPHLASLRVRDLRPDPALLQRLTQVADAAQRNREAAAGGAAQGASLNQGQASGTATAPGGEGLQAVAEGALGAQGQGGVAAPGGPTSVGEGSSAAAAAPMDLAASSTAPPAPASLAGRSATGADLVPPGEPAPCPPAAPPAEGQREEAVREEGKAVGMEVGQAAGEEEGGAAAGAPAQGAPPVVGGQVAGAKRGAGGQPGPEEQPEAKRLAAGSGEQQGQADEGMAPPASDPLAPPTAPQGPPNSPPASPLHPTSPPASPGSDMHNGPDLDPCGPCSSPQPPRRAPPHPWLIPAAPLGPLHHTMQQDPRQALLDVLREYHASQLEQEQQGGRRGEGAGPAGAGGAGAVAGEGQQQAGQQQGGTPEVRGQQGGDRVPPKGRQQSGGFMKGLELVQPSLACLACLPLDRFDHILFPKCVRITPGLHATLSALAFEQLARHWRKMAVTLADLRRDVTLGLRLPGHRPRPDDSQSAPDASTPTKIPPIKGNPSAHGCAVMVQVRPRAASECEQATPDVTGRSPAAAVVQPTVGALAARFSLWLQFESQELSSSVVAPWQSNLARYSRSNALHADGLGQRGEGDEGRAGVDSAVQGVVRMASALSNQAAEVAAEVARTASAVAALRLMDASSVSCTLSLLAPLAGILTTLRLEGAMLGEAQALSLGEAMRKPSAEAATEAGSSKGHTRHPTMLFLPLSSLLCRGCNLAPGWWTALHRALPELRLLMLTATCTGVHVADVVGFLASAPHPVTLHLAPGLLPASAVAAASKDELLTECLLYQAAEIEVRDQQAASPLQAVAAAYPGALQLLPLEAKALNAVRQLLGLEALPDAADPADRAGGLDGGAGGGSGSSLPPALPSLSGVLQVPGCPRLGLRFQLPASYPLHAAAQLSVQATGSSRQQHAQYEAVVVACADRELGSACLMQAMAELMVGGFHHIKSLAKRKAILQSARDLQLGGACKPGFPGVILVEGFEQDVEEFTAGIRAMRWQAMQEVQAENELLMTEAQLLHAIEEVLAAKMHDLEEKHQHLQAAHRQLRLDNESLEAVIEQCNLAITIARRDMHRLEAQLRKFQRRPLLTRKQRQQLQILKQTGVSIEVLRRWADSNCSRLDTHGRPGGTTVQPTPRPSPPEPTPGPSPPEPCDLFIPTLEASPGQPAARTAAYTAQQYTSAQPG
ncbi:hypothetical protein QJQ45_020223, partial [Haematococcus lacustris]